MSRIPIPDKKLRQFLSGIGIRGIDRRPTGTERNASSHFQYPHTRLPASKNKRPADVARAAANLLRTDFQSMHAARQTQMGTPCSIARNAPFSPYSNSRVKLP
jgi:hypothetical protein